MRHYHWVEEMTGHISRVIRWAYQFLQFLDTGVCWLSQKVLVRVSIQVLVLDRVWLTIFVQNCIKIC